MELGVTGIRDAKIAMPDKELWGPIHQLSLSHPAVLHRVDEGSLKALLLAAAVIERPPSGVPGSDLT